MLYLDLATLESLFDPYWLWSSRGFNVASFKRRAYYGDPSVPLLTSVRQLVKQRLAIDVEQVFLLTNLAYFGYCFNPISVYFCHAGGQLVACVAEVTNTPWGESHQYVLVPRCIRPGLYDMQMPKQHYVSPFLAMDYQYHLRCYYTRDKIMLYIANHQAGQRHFYATLNLTAQPMDHRHLRRVLLRFPWMTGRIISGIYWQALKLWWKGATVYSHSDYKG